MAENTHRRDIEGLRGIAILLVVLFHAGARGFSGAFVGVDVFFVLSGFFITGPLVSELATTERLDLTAFYGKRALRILPPLLVMLLFALTVMTWLNAPIDRANIAATTIPVAFGAGNIGFASSAVNYFSNGDNPLLHTWSLGVEQQFYLVWPVLLLALFLLLAGHRDDAAERRMMRVLAGVAVVALVSFALSLWLTWSSPAWAFFGLPTRLWEFALGGVVAMLVNRRAAADTDRAERFAMVTQITGISLIAVAVVLYDRGTPYPGVAALLPALGACAMLIAGGAAGNTPVGRVLAVEPLQWLGRMSFGWYLWHWPLMGLGAVLHHDIGVAGRLAWATLALLLAWLSYQAVEHPVRTGKLGLARRSTFSASLVACALVALVALGVKAQAGRTTSAPSQRRFAAARADRMQHDCWASTVRGPGASCVFGDANAARTLVLLGDSHAEHWLAGLDRAGRDHGWRIVAMVRGGCPVADMSGLANAGLERRFRECAHYREGTLQRVIAMRPAAVLLSSWDHYIPFDVPAPGTDNHEKVSTAEWTAGLRRTYARLASAGVPLVVMRGTPRTWFDVPACLSRRAAGLPFAESCEFDRAKAWSRSGIAAQSEAARGLPVRFLDMNDQICAAGTATCSVERNGVVMYTDDNHLTASFTRALAPELGRRLSLLIPTIANDRRLIARRADAPR